jgi:hypothetical protein
MITSLSHSYLGLAAVIIWTLPWKGVALWKAANKKQTWWFAAMLVLNTVGILEILYIFVFSKMKKINNA